MSNNMLYNLNIQDVICHLYLNKSGQKESLSLRTKFQNIHFWWPASTSVASSYRNL